ncbi:hypothetical protein [Streptomyces griseoluteus]
MPKRGGRWRDHREVMIEAIAFKFQTGTQ